MNIFFGNLPFIIFKVPFVRDSPFLIVKEAQPLGLLSEGEVFRKQTL